MSDFFAMGGYGAYVWAAYGITALSLLLLFVWAWFGARAREAELEQVRKLSRAERRSPSTVTPSTAAVSAGTTDGRATGGQPLSAADSRRAG